MLDIKKIKKNLGKFSNFKKLSKNKKNIDHKKIKSLKFYILLAIILNIGFIIFGYFYYINKKNNEHQQIANHIATEFEGFLNYSQLLLNSVNHEILKNKVFSDKTVDILTSIDRVRRQNIIANDLYFEGMLYWIDSNKYLIASSAGKVLKPIDLSSRDYLEKTEHEPWKLHVGKVIVGALSGQNILPIAVGVASEKGNHLGTSVLSVKIESLISKINISLQKTSLDFAIISNDGNLVFETKKNIIDKKTLAKINKNSFIKNGPIKEFNILNRHSNFMVASRIIDYPFTIIYSSDKKIIYHDLWKNLLPYFLNIFILLIIYYKSR